MERAETINTQTRLDGLLEELDRCVRASGTGRIAKVQANVLGAERLRHVPLVHGMSKAESLLQALRDGALRSRDDLKLPRLPSEQFLGIRDVVYTCAGVLYPKRRFVLVFARAIEDMTEASASPWDTGALCSDESPLCPHLPRPPSPERRELFEKTCLPAPYYRVYFVRYVASCFFSADEYLMARKHTYADPDRVMSEGNWLSRLFEVRFRTKVPISKDSLIALFVPRGAGDRASLAIRERFDQIFPAGTEARPTLHIYTNENEPRLISEVRTCVQKHIREREQLR